MEGSMNWMGTEHWKDSGGVDEGWSALQVLGNEIEDYSTNLGKDETHTIKFWIVQCPFVVIFPRTVEI